tara:strand:- start:3549 stop:3788 length:240 start_codon:yes stop_codon:yes gene_type:complete
MKEKTINYFEKFFLNHCGLVETVFDQLKTICHIDHSRHRKPDNFVINLISGLIAYILKQRKPVLKLHNKIKNIKLITSN